VCLREEKLGGTVQPVRSSDARTREPSHHPPVVFVADSEPVLTEAAATVLARLVRSYLDAKRAAA